MAEIIISEDNSGQVLNELERKIQAALEACGNQAVSHAKQNITAGIPRNSGSWYTPTGDLRNSMTHKVASSEKSCYVGTNMNYAIYNELGTGKFTDGGGGRKGWWVYVAGGGTKSSNGKIYSKEEAKRVMAMLRAKGLDAHMTEGIKPLHFLRNAIRDHVDEYKSIIENELEK